jgi:signal transduction histidine kinase/DNA-binding response OmpR family regulator/HPt (histidine-containing phosphotransfer) domain-containing protein
MPLQYHIIAVLFMALLGSGPAAQAQERAQSAPLPATIAGMVILTEGTQAQSIGPNIFVTPNPEGRISYSALIEGHLGTRRGVTSDTHILSLGTGPTPHWLVFSVRNATRDTTRWVLTPGTRTDGRWGALERFFAFEHGTKSYLFYAMPDRSGAMPAPHLLPFGGRAVPLTLAPGQTALITLYAVPEGGGITTLAPRIMTEEFYIRSQADLYGFDGVMLTGLILAAGVFAGLFVFRGRWLAVPVLAYIGAQFALYSAGTDDFISGFVLAAEQMPLLFNLVIIAGYVMTGFYLKLKLDHGRERIFIAFMIIAISICSAFAVLFINDASPLRPAIIGGAGMIGLVLLFLFSLAQAFAGRGGVALVAGWFLLLAGAGVSVISVLGVIPTNALLANFIWYAVLTQLFILTLSAIYESWSMEKKEEDEETDPVASEESRAMIRQAKDSSENARLLRVIEHERQMLQELRDREVQQNEEMRRAKEAADIANRAKSAFLAVISHEIRTPMTGIMGMVRLLLGTSLSKEQKDYVRTIQDSGEAMLSLLNDILDFEKIETGKMDLEIIDFDLHRLVNDIMTLMSGHASQKKIALQAHIDDSVPRFIRGDPVRLRQVLLNLTGNAIKFTSEGGVTLTMTEAKDEGTQKPGWVRLYVAVKDSGIGISEEAQKNLFNPFSQADSSISRKYGGSGLGLAICQRLIEAMGGKIQIASKENEGSTFYFTISVELGQADRVGDSASAPGEAIPARTDGPALTILCVDDNEINQKLLREFVSRLGHTPVLAGSAEEALDILRQQDFDMVLMDVQLPGISGMGATRAIRAMRDPKKASLPVIALTGNVRDEDVRNCYAANMNGHLAKPIEPEKLKAQIEKVIHGTLDNPVSLEESDMQSFAVNEIKITPPDESATQSFGIEDLGAFGQRARMNAQEEAIPPEDDFSIDPEPATTAPIRAFAFDEEDLDDDSFAQAAALGEAADNNRHENDAVFDKTILGDLKTSMKPQDLQEMIDSLLDKIEEISVALRGAVDAQDIETIRARSHELKGMCGNFGLNALSGLAAQMEKAARDYGMEADYAALIAPLPEAVIQARQAITQWVEE